MILEFFALGAILGYSLPIPTFFVLLVALFLKYKQSNVTLEQIKRQAQNLSWSVILAQVQAVARGEPPKPEENLFAMPVTQQNFV
jgi:hypothetical protein